MILSQKRRRTDSSSLSEDFSALIISLTITQRLPVLLSLWQLRNISPQTFQDDQEIIIRSFMPEFDAKSYKQCLSTMRLPRIGISTLSRESTDLIVSSTPERELAARGLASFRDRDAPFSSMELRQIDIMYSTTSRRSLTRE